MKFKFQCPLNLIGKQPHPLICMLSMDTFPASGSFQMSQLFASGGQSIGVSASTSVLPMNIQDWSFRVDWLHLLAAQGTLKSLLQHHSSKASEGLMLKLKLQYFGHLMRRVDSLEKTLMLGKIEGRRRGPQRMRWLDGITNSTDMGLACCGSWGCKESDTTEWLNWMTWWTLLATTAKSSSDNIDYGIQNLIYLLSGSLWKKPLYGQPLIYTHLYVYIYI